MYLFVLNKYYIFFPKIWSDYCLSKISLYFNKLSQLLFHSCWIYLGHLGAHGSCVFYLSQMEICSHLFFHALFLITFGLLFILEWGSQLFYMERVCIILFNMVFFLRGNGSRKSGTLFGWQWYGLCSCQEIGSFFKVALWISYKL